MSWAMCFETFRDGEAIRKRLEAGWEPYAVDAYGHWFRKQVSL